MSAKYLIRIDDICPTMDWAVWEPIEAVLTEMNVKPMIAVIPDNRDEKLKLGQHDPHFWDRVRGWQAKGWTVGLHGYQHRFQTEHPGIMGINRYSEFAGLPLGEQERKLSKACEIFCRERVTPDIWIAPAHSFDENTVKALIRVGVRSISDGFALYPYVDADGVLWVPQQLWRFRSMPVGLWTICIHYTDPPHRDADVFRRNVEAFRPHLTSYPEVAMQYGRRRRTVVDVAFGASLRMSRNSRARLQNGKPAQAMTAVRVKTAAE